MIIQRKIRNLMDEVEQKYKYPNKKSLFNYFGYLSINLAIISFVIFIINLIAYLALGNASEYRIPIFFLGAVLFFTLTSYIFAFFYSKLEKKVIDKKIKILEKNSINYFENIKFYFENDQKNFDKFLLLLEDKEKTKEQQKEIIDLLLRKEDAFYNQRNKEKTEEKNQEKLKIIKIKYQLPQNEPKIQELEINSQKIGYKYNL